jgi:hypothetical protein
MTNPLPSLTDRQLKTHEVFERIRMAWAVLYVVLGSFLVVLVALLFAAFTNLAGPHMKWAFATIDSLLGFCLHQVVRHIFPIKKLPTEKL